MPLSAGTRLGPYEIVAPLGAGGMGEVYRARDTKLNRDVAIKVLLPAVANDPERLARFRREAQVLAALNHPNIAQIYGFEDSGATHALVMELVDGPTLADRIAKGPLPIDEALPIARQIADALEAAHEQGIIHRDLKPANIKVKDDGTVKVLDFGLAKALEPAEASRLSGGAAGLTQSPTITTPAMMTGVGMILGTAAYMSPEQAKGRPADKRSDVWAFGCVLYEMLTGVRAFEGEDVSDLLAAVLTREPDLGALPQPLHPRLRELIGRCLEKNPNRRWQAVGDVRLELETITLDPFGAQVRAIHPASRPLWKRMIPVAAAAILTALITGVASWNLKPSGRAPVTRFSVILPEDVRLSGGLLAQDLAISPDGTRLVYVANGQLYLRSLADMEARPIAGVNNLGLFATGPFFSPDGQWIGFFASDSTLRKIAVGGGVAVTLCQLGSAGGLAVLSGASWDGDQIVFAEAKGIMRVSANGGEPELIVAANDHEVISGPRVLDRGRALLFTVTTETGADRWDHAQIVVHTLSSGTRTVIVRGGADARYVPAGHLVYAVGGTLLAMPFDLETLAPRGVAVPVVEGVKRAPNSFSAFAHAAVSATGTLVYIPASPGSPDLQKLALVDRNGTVESLGLPAQAYRNPRLSPDGRRIVVGTDDGKDAIVAVYDLNAGGALRRLTFEGRNLSPIWSRDGRFITFASDREGGSSLFRQPADGSGAAERLTKAEPGVLQRPEDWNRDGSTLSFIKNATTVTDIWTLSIDGDRKTTPLITLPSSGNKRHSVFSPDGRWLAYASQETINVPMKIFVEPFPPTGAKYQIGTGGGNPLWSPDGQQLFHIGLDPIKPEASGLVAVDVHTQPTFSFGTPRPIPVQGAKLNDGGRNYDVTPDGTQFLVVLPASAGQTDRRPGDQINVVLNWFEELKARVPTK